MDLFSCLPASFRVNGKEMCINIYDVRYDDLMPACGMNWPPDIKPITTYLDASASFRDS